ncbi:c-type cytochrome [candidate division KSB1 bacterium]|nr:c-type cytochrome [candidate division KSB1 bacterium]NIS27379.1 c-type cytochrome [candidate division KSB1 bacterium]NIU28096.1 c-type cytochrome [candidate division KSB1 bacterium]NIU90244.1 c-type cytochrome [candidate division KSB1 bacterium]NIV92331.1 c-type cytochrome [candidate division KSB1 bacterium]
MERKKLTASTLVVLLFGFFLFGHSLLAGADEKHVVRLTNIEFRPNRLKVDVGDSIKFINKDEFKHDVYLVRTANPNDVLLTATTIESGEATSVTIEEEGLFTLYCTIHGGMRGKITTTDSFELTEEEKKRAAAKKVLPPIVKTGEELFWNEAQCHQCHQIGDRGDGIRGPNLSDIGFRSRFRAEKLGLASGTEYLIQSILEPSAYLVEAYTNDMATVYQPPIDLNEQQIKAIISYLQSQGGQVDTWAIDIDAKKLQTKPTMNPFKNGDPERGKTIFTDAGCPSCHTTKPGEKKSSTAGPDLTAIGAFRNWTWLAESVIDPNAEIGSNWRYTTVFLKPESDGFQSEKTVFGFVRENTEEEVKILLEENRIATFSGDQVKRVEISELSKMPTNYGEILTFQQMADLIRYLQTLKGEQETAGQASSAGQK